MNWKGKSVLVTGGGSGIGRSTAIAFASAGAMVFVADINARPAQETVNLIAAAGGVGLAIETDVADPESVMRMVEEIKQSPLTLYAIVNNAAIQISKTVLNTSFDEWNRQMAVNVGGVFLCSKYFLPLLIENKGSIVNLSSVNGYFVEPDCAGYCCTKAAIIGLTRAMAIDHGPQGVRVNCICPGYIDAGLAEGYFQVQPDPVRARKEAGYLHALWRIGKPEEVGKAAVFLASDDASFITGTALAVDGGFGSGLPPKP